MFKPLLGLAVSVCAAAAGAQLLKDLKPITAAVEAAQKTVRRPGDAALSCAALEKELCRQEQIRWTRRSRSSPR
jgi:hypothetical protein